MINFFIFNEHASKMRVGNDMVYLEERKCYVFDDSFEHEVIEININALYIY